MRLLVVDVETTGIQETDQVVELAVVTIEPPRIVAYQHSVVRPSVPVHPEARATHHLSDKELSLSPSFSEVAEWFSPLLATANYFAAHNAPFDTRILLQTWSNLVLPPVIDTYRVARHLYPEAPRHSNQVLRYAIPGLATACEDFPDPANHPLNLPCHRALPDAWVTANLLLIMLKDNSVEKLAELSNEPVLLQTCPMGRNRGKPFAEVPMGDLDWISTLPDLDSDLAHTVRYWRTKSDRVPLLLETIEFGKHKGIPFAKVPRDYLAWLCSQSFDSDTIYTARHWLNGG